MSLRAPLTVAVLLLLGALVLVSCSDSVSEPEAVDLTSLTTWEVVRDHIVATSCTQSCHSPNTSTARQSGLVLTPDVAWESLIDAEPYNAAARDAGLVLVSTLGPAGVSQSFLWEKINWPAEDHFYDDHPEYGELMPQGGPPLTYGELEFIRRWIAAGAPGDGVVADVALLQDQSRYRPRPFEGLEPPAPGEGMQLRLGPFPVPPGRDREIFVYEPLGLAEDFWVNRVEISMKQGSHHFILYRFNGTPPGGLPAPGEIRDLRDENGNLVSSTLTSMFYHENFVGAQTPRSSYSFPPGVAMRLPAGEGFDLNSHYVNRGVNTREGEVHVNLYRADPAEIRHEARTLNLNNLGLVLPPGQVTTLEQTFHPPGFFLERHYIFQLVSHAHQHMLEFRAFLVGGPRDGELVYISHDWEHPPTVAFDPPLVIGPGDADAPGIRIETTYDNWTDRTLRFGFESEDEMMILFGLYYTE